MNSTQITVAALIIALVGYLIYTVRKLLKSPMANDHEKLKILTDQNFQNEIKTELILVDFWAEWCMPCKMMTPILNDVAEALDDDAFVGKVNIEQYQSIASEYNVRSIPTLILFKNGIEINRFVGIKDKNFLLKQIHQHK